MRYFGQSAIRFQPEKCKQCYCLMVNKFMNINLDLKLAKSMTVIMSHLIGNGEKLGAHGPRPIWWMMTIFWGHVFLSFFISSSILQETKNGEMSTKLGANGRKQRAMVNPGFLWRGWGRRQLQGEWTPTYYLTNFLPKTAREWRKLGWERGVRYRRRFRISHSMHILKKFLGDFTQLKKAFSLEAISLDPSLG